VLQVEGLRGTCVPEEALRQAREEGDREKERLRSELEVVRGDMERERQRGVVLIERLEERLAAASEEAAEAIARCRSLQQQIRQTEKQSRRERRQREFAQEQIKTLMGEDDADAKRSADVKPSKLALAASQRWELSVKGATDVEPSKLALCEIWFFFTHAGLAVAESMTCLRGGLKRWRARLGVARPRSM
jgi:hypothetical protein